MSTALCDADAGASDAFAYDENAASTHCDRADNPAIRASFPFGADTIEFGRSHSPTFASLVADVEASDVVVLIEPVAELREDLHGYLTFLAKTGGCRYVRVLFDARLRLPQIVAIIGHELRHVVEVAQHSEVVDPASMKKMYQQFGRRGNYDNSCDSVEAIAAGRRVAMEIVSGPSATFSPSEPER
jgi:hypothetical protein